MAEVLPATPNTYGDDAGGFKQRWVPGAFGDLTTLEGVSAFRVLEAEWDEADDGTVTRTILKAVALPG